MSTTSREEVQRRGNWGSTLEFILSTVGYTVGLGNVWRFPYVAYRHGGVTFIIAYWIIDFIIGLTLFTLEVAIGQFSAKGPIAVWSLAPLFRGIGYAASILTMFYVIYAILPLSWILHFLFYVIQGKEPWLDCIRDNPDAYWTNEFCNIHSISDCALLNATTNYDEGTCLDSNDTLVAIQNRTLAASFNITGQLSTEQYYYGRLIGEKNETNFDNIGPVSMETVCFFLAAWLVAFLGLMNGHRSIGKMVYVTTTMPYVGLITLLVYGIALDGGRGIALFLTPNWPKLLNWDLWFAASLQCFYSLGPGWGALISLSSYSKFHNNFFRDAIITVFADAGTSFLASCVVFSFMGMFTEQSGLPIEKVVTQGPGLVFVMYPIALSYLPHSAVFSTIFYITILFVGMGSQVICVQGILTVIFDYFPKSRRTFFTRVSTMFGLMVFLLIPGFAFCTRGCDYLVYFLDTLTAGWQTLLIAFLELSAVVYCYGVSNYFADIFLMVPSFKKYRCLSMTYKVMLCAVAPGVISVLIVYGISDSKPMEYRDYVYPMWSVVVVWLCRITILSPLPLNAAYVLYKNKANLRRIWRPADDWKPAIDIVDGKERELLAQLDSKDTGEKTATLNLIP